MSDLLVDLSANPWFRQTVKQLGLPIPTPQKLSRPTSPRVARPLHDQIVLVRPTHTPMSDALAGHLAEAGANPHLLGVATPPRAWVEAGEGYGRPPTMHRPEDTFEGVQPAALICDTTDMQGPDDLRALYDFFNPTLPLLSRCGRVVVLARPPEGAASPAGAAAAAALGGFVRSLAKELGRRGATAHVVYVAEGAEGRADAVLRFLLSARSAFVSGQPWRVTATVNTEGTVRWVRPLDGKIALVTGAARGIGAATAHVLAGEGARVICLDRPGDEDHASRVADAVGGVPLMVDITASDAPERIRDFCRARFDGVDVVVHNAGITRDKTLARMKPEWWDQAVDVNLSAVLRINDAILDDTVRDGGRVICLSSVAGIAGNAGQTNYAASKAGLVGYVDALAQTTARRGITVNAVAPGFIETRLTAAIPAVTRAVGRRLSALGQGGVPSDVAELITFLATPAAGGLTGQVFRACGGMFLGA